MIRRRHKVVWLAAMVLSVLWFLGFLLWDGREPSDQGRTLSQWLETLDNTSAATNAQTITALRQMGGKAAVRLVPMLAASDSPLKLWVVELARKQSFVQVRFTPASVKRQRAERAFEMMGEQAAAAAPGLVSILLRRGIEPKEYLEDPASRAANALGCLGYRTIPHLRPVLCSEHVRVRQEGLQVLVSCSYNSAPETMAELFKLLDDSDPKVRQAGAVAVGRVHRQPELVLPRLVRLVGDPDPGVRKQVGFALGRFGPQAREAIPALRQACSDADPTVRHAAEAALVRIAGGTVPSQ